MHINHYDIVALASSNNSQNELLANMEGEIITSLSHVQIHKNQPPKAYQCGKCQKSFSIKRNLLQHLRNHNKDTLTIFKASNCTVRMSTKRQFQIWTNVISAIFLSSLWLILIIAPAIQIAWTFYPKGFSAIIVILRKCYNFQLYLYSLNCKIGSGNNFSPLSWVNQAVRYGPASGLDEFSWGSPRGWMNERSVLLKPVRKI